VRFEQVISFVRGRDCECECDRGIRVHPHCPAAGDQTNITFAYSPVLVARRRCAQNSCIKCRKVSLGADIISGIHICHIPARR
jgi:hypothetical protein